eukprot:TRINITY_DN69297_c0_g1_i1.p1 TRINITY_DN69297_c0_g1~~TRINITY_DN69297_c0_g1_i1.p1  ORF type:complete len:404 (+),score=45.25 TRINITY_DN69297_c0_g1_i1:54-1265(+)
MTAVHKIVLVRHGESEWNKANLFTGWMDVGLSDKGRQEANEAAEELFKDGFEFDTVYTSVLKRAIHTMNAILKTTKQDFLPVTKAWQLNERMYGALQGLDKKSTAEKYGEQQVKIWRRSYDIPPPPMDRRDPKHPANYRGFASVPPQDIPDSESLASTLDRVLPYWENVISRDIRAGKRVLIVAHGNSLRALVKHLDNVSEADIVELNIPTGVPLVYELDADLKPIKHYYLGDQDAIAARTAAVASQAAGKKDAPPVPEQTLDDDDEAQVPSLPVPNRQVPQHLEASKVGPGVPQNPQALASAFASILRDGSTEDAPRGGARSVNLERDGFGAPMNTVGAAVPFRPYPQYPQPHGFNAWPATFSHHGSFGVVPYGGNVFGGFAGHGAFHAGFGAAPSAGYGFF